MPPCPPQSRTQTGILTGNYGEGRRNQPVRGGRMACRKPSAALTPTGCADMAIHLRRRSSWWGKDSRNGAERFFERCDLAGQITNRYGVESEETESRPRHLDLPGTASVLAGLVAEPQSISDRRWASERSPRNFYGSKLMFLCIWNYPLS